MLIRARGQSVKVLLKEGETNIFSCGTIFSEGIQEVYVVLLNRSSLNGIYSDPKMVIL